MEIKKEIKKCLVCNNFVRKHETDSWKKYNLQRKYCSLECRQVWNKGLDISDSRVKAYVSKNTSMFKKGENMAENNNKWKGEDASYIAKHMRIYRDFGTARECSLCYANVKRYNWSNIDNKYSRDIKDWIQLCPSCHKKFDLYKKYPEKYEKYVEVYNSIVSLKKVIV